MQITSATDAAAAAAGTKATAKAPTLGYNQFLQLLIAQLKNQDPTAPSDSTQFVSQLASFSGVEQAVQTNSKLDAILSASAMAQAEGLIGRTVTTADGATSGIVRSVTTTGAGATATLDNGATIPITSGMRVA